MRAPGAQVCEKPGHPFNLLNYAYDIRILPSLRAKRGRDILPKFSCPEEVNPEDFSANPNSFWVAASPAAPRNDCGGGAQKTCSGQ